MGWTGLHRPAGLTHEQFFRDEFKYPSDPEAGLVAIKGQGFNLAYAAVKHPSGVVFGVVIRMQFNRGDYYNFTFRTDEETVGPIFHTCPQSILDLLTPDDECITQHDWEPDGYWLDWRNKCRANLARRAALRKLKPGAILKFKHPLSFSNGVTTSEFILNRERTFNNGTKTYFTAREGGYTRYNIPHWRDRDLEIITP